MFSSSARLIPSFAHSHGGVSRLFSAVRTRSFSRSSSALVSYSLSGACVNRSARCVLGSRRYSHALPAFKPVDSSPEQQKQVKKMEADSPHFLSKDQKVIQLDAKDAFEGLSEQSKLYAHHLSRASWYGGLIVLHQISPESPLLFVMFHRVMASQTIAEVKAAASEAGISEEDVEAIEAYVAAVYAYMGNYKDFGDIKIIPRVGVEVMEKFLKATAAFKKDPDGMSKLWSLTKKRMYSLEPGTEYLGFNGKGVTTYFSSNCNEEDAHIVGKFLTKKKIGMYNHRVFKTVEESGRFTYEIRLAAVKDMPLETEVNEEFEGAVFRVTRGDYGPLLQLVSEELREAVKHASNEHEKAMLAKYADSFEEGSLEAHYDGSRHWIKNKGPVIETYIGFIETYRDPAGCRGEFEGFVAMVNKEMSKRFAALVDNAEKFLEHMPWPREFEKDKFLQPDFTSLDVLTFAGGGIPAGINIPNYDEIRQSEGFKNVSLGNVIFGRLKVKGEEMPFLTKEDAKLLEEIGPQAFELQVGLHELLGHGSGKLLTKNDAGEFNFDKNLVNPLTKQPVSTWYEPGETWDSKFGGLSNAYEECRAETTCLQLAHIPEILEIFDCEGEKAEKMLKVVWLNLIVSGFKSLETWQPSTKTWLQAHSQGRYVILRVLLEAGGGLISIEETTGADGKPDLLLKVDYSKIAEVGRPAIAEFLLKLQVFKSTGDFVGGSGMFLKYAEVPEDGPYPFAKWRDILMARRKPRKMLICPNTFVKEGRVELKSYGDSAEGLIESFVDRFPIVGDRDVTKLVYGVWEKDLPHFPLE